MNKSAEREEDEWLTAHFKEQLLVVFTDGVAGSAEVTTSISELDVLQGEGGDPCMCSYHDVPIKALQRTR